MIDLADTSGLAFAAVALSTASLAAAVRRGEISVGEMRAIIADAHALVHEQAGFVVDPKAAQAADDFLSAAEARNQEAFSVPRVCAVGTRYSPV